MRSLWVLLSVLCCTSWNPAASLPDAIKQAELRWYRATCRLPTYQSIRVVPGPLYCGGNLAFGCYTFGVIEISSHTPVHLFHRTLLHEMAHTFTASHLPAGQGVSSRYVDQSTAHITLADITSACENRDCPCRRPESP